MTAATFIAVLGFVVIHLASKHMKFLERIPRSRLLSAAGGVSVSYVFLHLLPELEEHREVLSELGHDFLQFVHYPIYTAALIGLVTFYGIERFVKRRNRSVGTAPLDHSKQHIFFLHIASFFLYNLLIGYLLVHREDTGMLSLFLYFFAMGLHFLTNDQSLRMHHKGEYDHVARWLLAGAVLLGWGVGLLFEVPEAILSLLFAFLAGSIILNVLKEELPEERESSFIAFIIGAVGYSVLLMLL